MKKTSFSAMTTASRPSAPWSAPAQLAKGAERRAGCRQRRGPLGPGGRPRVGRGRLDRLAGEGMPAELSRAREYLEGQAVTAVYQEIVGDPAEAIVQFADQRKAEPDHRRDAGSQHARSDARPEHQRDRPHTTRTATCSSFTKCHAGAGTPRRPEPTRLGELRTGASHARPTAPLSAPMPPWVRLAEAHPLNRVPAGPRAVLA